MRQHSEGEKDAGELSPRGMLRERIAKRAALEFKDGMYGILYITIKYTIPTVGTTSL